MTKNGLKCWRVKVKDRELFELIWRMVSERGGTISVDSGRAVAPSIYPAEFEVKAPSESDVEFWLKMRACEVNEI